MKLRPALAALLLPPLLCPLQAGAEFYSYQDKNGTMHFVDDAAKIPREYRRKVLVRKDQYDDLPPEERARMQQRDREEREMAQRQEQEQSLQRQAQARRAAQEARTRALTTRVLIAGRQVFVPVRLSNGSVQTDAMLLLDTGATSSVISPAIAERLQLQESSNVRIGVVGGRVMNARKVILSQMEVGPVRRSNQEAVVVRQGRGEFGDGLLGMSFLAGLKYTIDFNTQTINWIP
ncbi:retroviral-like aspartic protease family protein [Geomonas paludis]|uniref:Retroviral-like aspartic protease family protein n=1 Tax=Geomonas paludis TaxID=2740185 RepID=A0A6V8MY73_9BACT|nr:retropepsin-like aspartic protease [Geomonas paludis]UPU34939.1 retroviral-like aspartic protease family protein [Geomonas paludis]GFO64607.1 hypothetical protein GMPD_25260 [Geomonas paludis]